MSLPPDEYLPQSHIEGMPVHAPPTLRTRSEASIPLSTRTDRLRREAKEEAERNMVLQSLVTAVNAMQSTLKNMSDTLLEVKTKLSAGGNRMDSLEKELCSLTKKLDDHLQEHKAEMAEGRKQWKGLVPAIVGSVLSSILTAALVGGVLAANNKTNAPQQEQKGTP